MQNNFTAYHDCLNQSFTLYSDETDHQLELIEVTRLHDGHDATAPAAFSIVFRADKDLLLNQGTYRMNNQALGELDIFIVPIGPDQEGMCYEAVFTG